MCKISDFEDLKVDEDNKIKRQPTTKQILISMSAFQPPIPISDWEKHFLERFKLIF
jgi:hypothetical protein